MSIDLTILKFLRAGGDMLTPETQLRDDVRLAVSPPPTGGEISEALGRIEGAGLALSFRDEMTKAVRWTITDEGRAQLAKRRL
ncbi:MAG: hypothetical protein U1G08_18090 [Verrucomicrobiota bacterium]